MIVHRIVISVVVVVVVSSVGIVVVRRWTVELVGIVVVAVATHVSTVPSEVTLPLRSIVLVGAIVAHVVTTTTAAAALSRDGLRIVHDRGASFGVRGLEYFDIAARRTMHR